MASFASMTASRASRARGTHGYVRVCVSVCAFVCVCVTQDFMFPVIEGWPKEKWDDHIAAIQKKAEDERIVSVTHRHTYTHAPDLQSQHKGLHTAFSCMTDSNNVELKYVRVSVCVCVCNRLLRRRRQRRRLWLDSWSRCVDTRIAPATVHAACNGSLTAAAAGW